jgi:hypothetical protein
LNVLEDCQVEMGAHCRADDFRRERVDRIHEGHRSNHAGCVGRPEEGPGVAGIAQVVEDERDWSQIERLGWRRNRKYRDDALRGHGVAQALEDRLGDDQTAKRRGALEQRCAARRAS